MLKDIRLPKGRVVRLLMNSQGWRLSWGNRGRATLWSTAMERTAFTFDAAIGDLLDKAVLDKVDTPEGPTLSIRHD